MKIFPVMNLHLIIMTIKTAIPLLAINQRLYYHCISRIRSLGLYEDVSRICAVAGVAQVGVAYRLHNKLLDYSSGCVCKPPPMRAT